MNQRAASTNTEILLGKIKADEKIAVDKFSGLLSDFAGKMGGESVKNALAAVLK